MDTLFTESRHAVRSLRTTTGRSIIAGLSLALGVGVTTTMFSAVDQLLVRPLPYKQSGRLMRLYQLAPSKPDVEMIRRSRCGRNRSMLWSATR